jgi:hypothetical protein
MRNRIFFLTLVVAALGAVWPAPTSVRGTSAAPPIQGRTAAAACDVEAYVVDPDPKGLNVRETPGAGGRVVAVIPLDGDGTVVHLIASAPNGWVQIDKAETVDGTVVFNGKGWVSGNMLATETRGYGTKGVKLRGDAKAGKIVGTVPPEAQVRVAGCAGEKIKVKYRSLVGWLDRESQCPNPVTLCS